MGFVVLAAVAVGWPGSFGAAGAAPRVRGLPFSLFWVVAWAGLGFVALWLYERARHRGAGA